MTRFHIVFFDEDGVEHHRLVWADDAACALAVVLDDDCSIAFDSPFGIYADDPLPAPRWALPPHRGES